MYSMPGQLLRVVFEDPEEERVREAAVAFERELERVSAGEPVTVLPANPAPLSLLRGRYRYHLLAKGPLEGPAFQGLVDRAADLAAGISRPAVKLDVDPASTG